VPAISATAHLPTLTPATPERSWRYAGWRVTLASTVGIFCWSVPPFSFAVFLMPSADEFGWTRQSVASAFGVSALVAALLAPTVGALVDRIGARRVVIPCLTAAGIVFAARGFMTPPFWHVAILFALTGLFGLGCAPVAYVRLLSTWFDQRRGQALGLAVSGAALGAMVHPTLAQALVNVMGWRNAQFVLSALMLALGLPVVVTYLRLRAQAPAPPLPAKVGRVSETTVASALATPAFWIIGTGTLCDSVVNSSMTVHLPALLSDRGVGAELSALALSTMGAAALCGRLSSGWLLDRFFGPYVAASLLAMSSAGLLVIAGAQSATAGLVAAALVGFGMGGDADVTPYLLTRYFGLHAFSTLYGWTFTATAIAWAVGPTLMGRAYDVGGSYTPHLFRLTVILVGATGLMLALPRYAVPPSEVSRANL